jgi:hypothetical protein
MLTARTVLLMAATASVLFLIGVTKQFPSRMEKTRKRGMGDT